MIWPKQFRLPHRRRVVHFMDVCFARTETFVYDFVRGCDRYQAWCLAREISPQPGLDFSRVCRTTIRWGREHHSLDDIADKILYKLFRRDDLPIYRALIRIRPAVIHAHFGPAGWAVLPYARTLGIPLLTSFYGYDASSLPGQPGWGERLRQLFEHGTGFLVEGPAMAGRLEALGCPREKVHLLPITINPEQYPFRARRLGVGEVLRILFVGRFVPKKGLPVLLRALALARTRLRPWELRIIGGGEAEEAMRNLVAELRLEDRVRFLGFQPRSEVVNEMDRTHLLAVPSVTAPDGDSEGGAPTILLEAQATGLPVLASDHADIPFVVADLCRPYLAAEGSVESLADRLLTLCANASRWSEFIEAGRDHVASQHGRANFGRLERLYEQLSWVRGSQTEQAAGAVLSSPSVPTIAS